MIRILILTGFAALVQAQAQPLDTTQALLVEVRQLRQALERSTLIGPRIQIAVERVKMQQDALSRVAQVAEESRKDLERAQDTLRGLTAKIKDSDAVVNQIANPEERKQVDSELREVKSRVEHFQAAEQSARARDAELQNRLRQEQALLDAANDRLNQIERALDQVKITP